MLEALADLFTAPVDVVMARASIEKEVVEDRARAAEGQRLGDFLKNIFDMQSRSQLAARSPETFSQAVQGRVNGTALENVSISADDLKGFAQDLAAVSPAAAQQIAEVQATGGDLVLPLGEVLNINAANPELGEMIRQVGRFGAENMSLSEAEEFVQNFDPNLQARIQELADAETKSVQRRARNTEAAWKALAPVREQMRAAGRSSEETNASMALQAAILENVASMSGMSTADWLAANPVRVVRGNEGASRGGVNQSAPVRGFNQAAPRGNFDPETGTISLFSTADESTFVHEMAHYWLKSLSEMAADYLSRNAAKEGDEFLQFVSDMFAWLDVPGMKEEGLPAALEWWRNASQDEQRQYHERFAVGFEAYLMAGKAPTDKLTRMFGKFVEWLKSVYVSAANLGVEMTPEVMNIYDRLFASEQAVIDARTRMSDTGIFDDLIRSEMSEAEFKWFVDLRARAVEYAEARLRRELAEGAAELREAKAGDVTDIEGTTKSLQIEYRRLVSKYRAELEDSKNYRALNAFTRRGVRDAKGNTLRFKFDAESLKDSGLSEKSIAWIKSKRMSATPKSKVQAQRIDPKLAAQIFGFRDPNALVIAMRYADEHSVIGAAEAMAEDEFKRRHGRNTDPRKLSALAEREAFNRYHLDILATEAAALKGAMGVREELKNAVLRMAKEIIGRKPYELRLNRPDSNGVTRESSFRIRPERYRTAERRAGEKALRLFSKGRPIDAADAKVTQLVQAALAREAQDAVDTAERFYRRVRAALKSETLDPAYQVQIHKIARSLGFARAKEWKQEQAISKFVEEHPEIQMAYQALPEELLNGDGTLAAVDGQTRTVDEIRALDRFMQALIKQGRTVAEDNRRTKAEQAAAEIKAAKKQLEDHMAKHGRKNFAAVRQTKLSRRLVRGIKGFFINHLQFLKACRIFDNNEQGVWTKLFAWRANDCSATEVTLKQKYAEKLNDVLAPLYKGLNDDVSIGGQVMSRQSALAILLNAGNDGNRDRLARGNSIGDAEIAEAASYFTADELKIVQKVWDLFEELRKEAAPVNRRVDGFEPEWIEPVPISLKAADGTTVTLKGGYWPIRYDAEFSKSDSAEMRQFQDALDAEKAAGYLAAQTARTYTKTRVKEGEEGAAIRLDLTAGFDGMNEVIHDIAWREYVADSYRLLRGVTLYDKEGNVVEKVPGLSEVLRRTYGPQWSRLMKDWLRNVALDGRSSSVSEAEKYTSMFRRGVSLAGLGFNLVSALVQLTGLIPAAARLGPTYMLNGLADFMRHPKQVKGTIDAMSPSMANRSTWRIREVAEIGNIVNGRLPIVQKLQRLAYAPMMSVQAVVDYATWGGAYRKALEDGMTEAEAIQYADQTVVDTQGSGLVKDRSTIEMGGAASQLFLAFYSYMGTAYNLGAMSLLGETNAMKRAAQLGTIFVFQPIVEQLLRDALQPSGESGDDDDSNPIFSAIRYSAGATVNFSMGTVFGVREAAGWASGLISGDPIYTYRGPSATRWFTDASTLAQQIQQGELDQSLLLATLNMFGIFGLPTAQVRRTLQGADALWEGDTDNIWALVAGYKE